VQVSVFLTAIQDDQGIDALASSQVQIAVALASSFDGVHQQFVSPSITYSVDPEHERGSVRVEGH
jgi:hypothetical protein